MTLDNTIMFEGKEFKLTSRQSQGCGEMYVFREIINNGLSEDCKIFQVYKNNGAGMEIIPYNDSKYLIPYLKEFIEKGF